MGGKKWGDATCLRMCVNDRRDLAVRVEAEGCCRRWGGAVGKAALFLVSCGLFLVQVS